MLHTETGAQIQQGLLKLVCVQHIQKLLHDPGAQTESVHLEIAGIARRLIPGIHRGIAEVILQIGRHVCPGAQIHGCVKFLHV